jgi:hypothetical protein
MVISGIIMIKTINLADCDIELIDFGSYTLPFAVF